MPLNKFLDMCFIRNTRICTTNTEVKEMIVMYTNPKLKGYFPSDTNKGKGDMAPYFFRTNCNTEYMSANHHRALYLHSLKLGNLILNFGN